MFKLKAISISILILSSQLAFSSELNRRITTDEELSKEIKMLVKTYDPEHPDILIRLFDYANRNSVEKGKILNLLVLAPKNQKDNVRSSQIASFINERIVTLKNTRLPKGTWSYQSGNSNFFAEEHTKTHSVQEVREAIGPNGVPFEYGYPNFKQYRLGGLIQFEGMIGSYQLDYDKALEQIPFRKIKVDDEYFETKQDFINFMQNNHVNLHYSLYEPGFELIPDAVYNIIDYEIPYVDKRLKEGK